jgi:hypothetical protein
MDENQEWIINRFELAERRIAHEERRVAVALWLGGIAWLCAVVALIWR